MTGVVCFEEGSNIEVNLLSDDNKSEKSLPSFLILDYREKDNIPIHVLVGFNGRKLLVISACYPDALHWMSDNKTRRN